RIGKRLGSARKTAGNDNREGGTAVGREIDIVRDYALVIARSEADGKLRAAHYRLAAVWRSNLDCGRCSVGCARHAEDKSDGGKIRARLRRLEDRHRRSTHAAAGVFNKRNARIGNFSVVASAGDRYVGEEGFSICEIHMARCDY